MGSGHLKTVKMVVLLLACLMAVEVTALGQRGRGRGRGHGHDRVVVAGVPWSQRGRGRNWNPRTRRGRYVRTVIRRNNRNWHPGTPRRRRVRRHGMH